MSFVIPTAKHKSDLSLILTLQNIINFKTRQLTLPLRVKSKNNCLNVPEFELQNFITSTEIN